MMAEKRKTQKLEAKVRRLILVNTRKWEISEHMQGQFRFAPSLAWIVENGLTRVIVSDVCIALCNAGLLSMKLPIDPADYSELKLTERGRIEADEELTVEMLKALVV
jgi:hypothetical protein